MIETGRLLITNFTLDMVEAVHLKSLDEDTRRFVPDELITIFAIEINQNTTCKAISFLRKDVATRAIHVDGECVTTRRTTPILQKFLSAVSAVHHTSCFN